MRLRNKAFGAALLIFAGCSDPYEKQVPASYFTDGEVEQIAGSLPPPDSQQFLRWAERMRAHERYPGEIHPPTVRAAILAQNEFDRYALSRQREVEAELAKIAERQQQEDLRQEIEDRKQFASDEISKFLAVTVTGYHREPIWAVTGQQIGWKWVFELSIKNSGEKSISAFEFTLKLSDHFDRYASSMTGQVAIDVPVGKNVSYAVTYPNNDDSPLHGLMRRGQQVQYLISVDSVVFGDGSRMDHMSVGK